MKRTIFFSLALVAVCCLVLFVPGCPGGDKSDKSAGTAVPSGDAHAALHVSKHGGAVAEFPGHRYALEVISDEDTGLVTAYLTDAHFNPVNVDTQTVRLDFVVGGAPKTYTLTRIETTPGTPAAFTFTDATLTELICDGWQGEATASVEIGNAPHKAKLNAG